MSVTTDTSVATVLALGCGDKQTLEDYFTPEWLAGHPMSLITLDANPHVKPALVCTLGRDRIALPDDTVDMVLALHVLEHIGQQGETTEWFQFWEELYRVMKPSAMMRFECPYYNSLWAWADPTHVRPISEMTFLYFNQDAYRTPQSAIPRFRIKTDFVFARDPDTGRPTWELVPDCNADIVAKEPQGSHIRGFLIARKPFRGWWEA